MILNNTLLISIYTGNQEKLLLKPVVPALLENGLDLSKVSGCGQDGDYRFANGCKYG
jgi:hypothetical protein